MKCPRTVNDGKDRCGWDGDEPADHAAEAGHQLCLLGLHFLRDDEIRICGKCLARAHDDLDVIETAYAMLAPVAEASGYHTGSLPGGDALVMLAEGRMDGGGPDDHVKFRDPIPVLAQLYFWERDWRETFGHGHPARWSATVDSCMEYLRQWMWLASRTHEAFDDYVNEINALRWKVDHVAGTADDPVRGPAACFDCGGRLLRVYNPAVPILVRLGHARELIASDTARGKDVAPRDRVRAAVTGGTREGLATDWTCSGCRAVYTREAYLLAARAAMEDTEALVTAEEFHMLTGIQPATVRQWVTRGFVEAADTEGRAHRFRFGDLNDRAGRRSA